MRVEEKTKNRRRRIRGRQVKPLKFKKKSLKIAHQTILNKKKA